MGKAQLKNRIILVEALFLGFLLCDVTYSYLKSPLRWLAYVIIAVSIAFVAGLRMKRA